MTTPGFSIDTESARRLVRVSMHGFWDEATIAAYDRQVRIAAMKVMEAAGCGREELRILVDARGLSAQSQSLLAAYKKHFDPADRQPGKIATLASSALFRRQVERIAQPNQRVFEDEDAATEWLAA